MGLSYAWRSGRLAYLRIRIRRMVLPGLQNANLSAEFEARPLTVSAVNAKVRRVGYLGPQTHPADMGRSGRRVDGPERPRTSLDVHTPS